MDVADLLLAGDWSSSAFYEAVDVASAADVAAVLALAVHEDPGVRGAVALTLPLLTRGDTPTADLVEAVVVLSADPDKRVPTTPASH